MITVFCFASGLFYLVLYSGLPRTCLCLLMPADERRKYKTWKAEIDEVLCKLIGLVGEEEEEGGKGGGGGGLFSAS